MLKGLVAGFGEPLGPALLAELRDRGVQLIRQDGWRPDGSGQRRRWLAYQGRWWAGEPLPSAGCAALVAEIQAAGLQSYLTVYEPWQVVDLPVGTWVGALNEPDLEVPEVWAAVALTAAIVEAAQDRGLRVFVGAVSNTMMTPAHRGLSYLRQLLAPVQWADKVGLDLHRYPKHARPLVPQDAHRTRGAEDAAIRALVAGRPLIIGEVGYHLAPQDVPRAGISRWLRGEKTITLTEAQQAQYLAEEFHRFEALGAVGGCVYQLNSGSVTSTQPDDWYGLRTAANDPDQPLRWRKGMEVFSEDRSPAWV